MNKWYALHTKVNHEQKVSRVLQLREIEAYLPQMAFGNPGKEKLQPLFPGYLFINLDLETANPSHWQWTPGLKHIVAYGKTPIPVPNEVINLIRQGVRESQRNDRDNTFGFKPGDQVRIKYGPFKDMLAVFDRASTPDSRVQVLLTMLNRSVRVRVAGTSLEKVSAGANGSPSKRPRRTRGRGRRIL